jgi:putative ABC transport system permease protein
VNGLSYALQTLWHERARFLAGILAVAFSAVLTALQCGLLLGLFSITSIPIDRTRADVWVGAAEVLSVDLGRPIPDYYGWRLANQPEVVQVETYIQNFAPWTKPAGGSELCIVIGSSLEPDALGAVNELTPELKVRLTEPMSIVVDEGELDRLGLPGVNGLGEIAGQRVRLVGLVHGLKSLAGPYIFCSVPTARRLLRQGPDRATFLLGKCRRPEDAEAVAQRLREYPTLSAWTAPEFSLRSRLHWLMKTKAGIALGYAALLGLLVGAVVTSQTLYAAVAAWAREFAVLRALGIPRWRMAGLVVAQAFWVGISGLAVAYPTVQGLAALADQVGAKVQLPWWLVAGTGALTLTMAMVAGLAALRSLRLVEPALLLR